MAVRGIDHNQIAFGIDQRLRAFKARITHRCRRCNAETARGVLRGVRIGHGLIHILDRDEAHAMEGLVDDQQLFDTVRVQQTTGFILTDACADGHKVLMRHQLGNRLVRIFGKAHITVSEDSDQTAAHFHNRNARDVMRGHQRLGLRQSRGRLNRDRVDHHPRFKALYLTDGVALLLDGQVPVQDAQAAQLRHHDRHIGLGHCIHGGRQDRDIECDIARNLRPRIRLAR